MAFAASHLYESDYIVLFKKHRLLLVLNTTTNGTRNTIKFVYSIDQRAHVCMCLVCTTLLKFDCLQCLLM